MSEPRAQRTLVKSPPELWAEISDAGTLARHLGELGDIRITRLEAETTVVWEGNRARGTVEIEASGWGTKVTITASAIAEEASTTAPSPAVEEEEEVAVVEEEPVAVEEPEPVAEEPEAVEEPAPRRRGFFARLFGRRDRPVPEPIVIEKPMAQAALLAAPESLVAIAVPEPEAIVPPEPEDAEIVITAMDDEQLEAVLVAVLDDLGSAHHRPFSRG
jgi:hypothetical protein